MARLLIWLLLGGVVWWLWRSRSRLPTAPSPRPSPPSTQGALPMARCHHCGMHLPAAEVMTDASGHAYCSPAHRDLGPPTP